MADAVEALLEFWKSTGADPRVPDPSAVSYVERLAGSKLPDDFRRYLEAVDGIEWDSARDTTLWKASEIVRACEAEAIDASLDPEICLFADYLMVCWWYGIRLSPDDRNGEIVSVDNNNYAPLCTSFSEFIWLYLARAESLVSAPAFLERSALLNAKARGRESPAQE